MKLTSPAFADGERIPSKYTCDGENINPPLHLYDIPEKARSLVLIMDDPDIPQEVKEKMNITVFDHWVVFNIPPETTEIKENSLPLGGIAGNNSRGQSKYTGPCPPPQYEPKEHRYFFKLFALDNESDLAEGATKEEIEDAMEGHILSKTEFMGRYSRE